MLTNPGPVLNEGYDCIPSPSVNFLIQTDISSPNPDVAGWWALIGNPGYGSCYYPNSAAVNPVNTTVFYNCTHYGSSSDFAWPSFAEGVLTPVSVIQNNQYIFGFTKQILPWCVGWQNYTSACTVNMMVRLTNQAHLDNLIFIPTEPSTWPAGSYQDVYVEWPAGATSLTMDRIVACFTANNNWDRLIIYPLLSGTNLSCLATGQGLDGNNMTAHWAEVIYGNIHFIEDYFETGSFSTTAGCEPVEIGQDLCSFPGINYLWEELDASGNVISVLPDNASMINLQPTAQTTFRLTRTFVNPDLIPLTGTAACVTKSALYQVNVVDCCSVGVVYEHPIW